MIAGKIFTWFLGLVLVILILFVGFLALPGMIEIIADSIEETKQATDKLKDALRRKENR